jgi:protein-tyrosine phosphatase
MLTFLKTKIPLFTLPFQADMHSHVLPGVDDGAKETEEALEILQHFYRAGIEQMYLTPHIDFSIYPKNTVTFLSKRYRELTQNIPRTGIPELYLAAEYMCNSQMDASAPLLCLHDSFVLIEMSYYYQSPEIEDIIFFLVNNNYKPILAHPERYTYLYNKLHVFEKYIDMGCSMQLNLLSLSGRYGPQSMQILKHLLTNKYYRYAGSDVHSPSHFRLLKETTISRKYAAPVEELLHNNHELFPLAHSRFNQVRQLLSAPL